MRRMTNETALRSKGIAYTVKQPIGMLHQYLQLTRQAWDLHTAEIFWCS